MKNGFKTFQVAFVFIGTVVGAGFASGKEVMQFFTRFGHWGAYMIVISTIFFVWIGMKIMLLSVKLKARSFEDFNMYLFGPKMGRILSYLVLITLSGVNVVMLAGAGALFSEHLHLNYQIGLLFTMLSCFFLLFRGMNGILTINTIVVPLMIFFTCFLAFQTLQNSETVQWLRSPSPGTPILGAFLSPFLYAGFNLSLSQAVLVPLGTTIGNPTILKRGSIIGGIGLGGLLLAGHFALMSRMPDIQRFEIPMGGLAQEFSSWLHWIYIFLIFMEIFTTLIADIFGLALQLHQRTKVDMWLLSLLLLLGCFLAGQFGFGNLLSLLYPLFGLFSLFWLFLISHNKNQISPPTF